jgi:hypothetical protein
MCHIAMLEIGVHRRVSVSWRLYEDDSSTPSLRDSARVLMMLQKLMGRLDVDGIV